MSLTPTHNQVAPLWAIHVHSIGQSGAGLVKALKQISPLSEQKIAGLLYQAPTKLFTDLPEQAARDIHQILADTGLDCTVVANDEELVCGDADHEVALVIKDVSQMTEIAKLIMNLIGADIQTVRQLLFTSPTVLLGKISKNTALKVRERFAELNVEVDISKPGEALFDVFLGECTDLQQHQLKQLFRDLPFDIAYDEQLAGNTLITAGLSQQQAEQIWQKVCRTALPVRIVNRDFERFDFSLLSLPDSPAAKEYLIASTGMPAELAPKALANLPLVLQQNISFAELEPALAKVKELGGEAEGNLLVFQTFALQITDFANWSEQVENTLLVLTSESKESLLASRQGDGILSGPFTSLQARWIQHELTKFGLVANRLLR